MPAKSKKQQKFMGMVHAAQKGTLKHPSPAVAAAAKSIKPKDAKEFASTPHKGLPEQVKASGANEELMRQLVELSRPEPKKPKTPRTTKAASGPLDNDDVATGSVVGANVGLMGSQLYHLTRPWTLPTPEQVQKHGFEAALWRQRMKERAIRTLTGTGLGLAAGAGVGALTHMNKDASLSDQFQATIASGILLKAAQAAAAHQLSGEATAKFIKAAGDAYSLKHFGSPVFTELEKLAQVQMGGTVKGLNDYTDPSQWGMTPQQLSQQDGGKSQGQQQPQQPQAPVNNMLKNPSGVAPLPHRYRWDLDETVNRIKQDQIAYAQKKTREAQTVQHYAGVGPTAAGQTGAQPAPQGDTGTPPTPQPQGASSGSAKTAAALQVLIKEAAKATDGGKKPKKPQDESVEEPQPQGPSFGKRLATRMAISLPLAAAAGVVGHQLRDMHKHSALRTLIKEAGSVGDTAGGGILGAIAGGALGAPLGIVPGGLIGGIYGGLRSKGPDETRREAIMRGAGMGAGLGALTTGATGATLGGLGGGMLGKAAGVGDSVGGAIGGGIAGGMMGLPLGLVPGAVIGGLYGGFKKPKPDESRADAVLGSMARGAGYGAMATGLGGMLTGGTMGALAGSHKQAQEAEEEEKREKTKAEPKSNKPEPVPVVMQPPSWKATLARSLAGVGMGVGTGLTVHALTKRSTAKTAGVTGGVIGGATGLIGGGLRGAAAGLVPGAAIGGIYGGFRRRNQGESAADAILGGLVRGAGYGALTGGAVGGSLGALGGGMVGSGLEEFLKTQQPAR